MSYPNWAAIIASLMYLTGCNAIPTLQYSKIDGTNSAKGITDSYYLAQSQITLDKVVQENEKTKKKTESYSVTSKPIAYDAYKIGVRPDNSLRVTTKINIVKLDNTDLVSSIGVETADNTVNLISQIGGAIVKLAAVVAAAPPQPGAPCIGDDDFPVQLVLDSGKLGQLKGEAVTLQLDKTGATKENGCIKVQVAAISKDAISSADLPFNQETSNYYYAACRDATVSFQQGTKDVSKTVRIADPNYVQFVQLPYQGTVTMHSACGVSVKTEGTSPQNAMSIVDALATQGKAIKDALEAAK